MSISPRTLQVALALAFALAELVAASPRSPFDVADKTAVGERILAVAYGPGGFVGVGVGGRIVTSTQGAHWQSRESGTQKSLYAVRHLNGLWIAVGERGTWLTSANGVDWALHEPLLHSCLRGLAYADGWLVTVGANIVFRTSDGLEWEALPIPGVFGFRDIAHGGGRFAVAAGQGKVVSWSTFGDWQVAETGVQENLQNILWTEAGFFATGGGHILHSADAQNWSTAGILEDTRIWSLHDFGDGRLAAGGQRGGDSAGVLSWSDNGALWSEGDVFAGAPVTSLAFGKNQLVVAGYGGLFRVDPILPPPLSIKLMGDETVVGLPESRVGARYELLYSPDLKVWEPVGGIVEGDGLPIQWVLESDDVSSRFFRLMYRD